MYFHQIINLDRDHLWFFLRFLIQSFLLLKLAQDTFGKPILAVLLFDDYEGFLPLLGIWGGI